MKRQTENKHKMRNGASASAKILNICWKTFGNMRHLCFCHSQTRRQSICLKHGITIINSLPSESQSDQEEIPRNRLAALASANMIIGVLLILFTVFPWWQLPLSALSEVEIEHLSYPIPSCHCARAPLTANLFAIRKGEPVLDRRSVNAVCCLVLMASLQ